MAPLSYPLQFLVVALAGWINQHQRDVIDYLRAENRVLHEQIGPRRLRFTDDQRIRLAAKAKHLQRRVLREIGTIVSPDTLLAWRIGTCSPANTMAPTGAGLDGRPWQPRFDSSSSAWQRTIATGATRGSKEPSPMWATTSGAGPSPPSSCAFRAIVNSVSGRC